MIPLSWMDRALEEAAKGATQGEVPVGAVLVQVRANASSPDPKMIFQGHNQVEATGNPLAHAEVLAIQEGCRRLGTPFLSTCDLYVTLEPCPLCASALSLARVRRVIFGAFNPKGGGVDHGPQIFDHPSCLWRPEVLGGVREEACQDLLKNFFKTLRS